MRVLVTGGAGYIGSVVTAQLAAAGHQVTVLDDLSTGFADAVPAGATLIKGTLRDCAAEMLSNGARSPAYEAVVVEPPRQPARTRRSVRFLGRGSRRILSTHDRSFWRGQPEPAGREQRVLHLRIAVACVSQ